MKISGIDKSLTSFHINTKPMLTIARIAAPHRTYLQGRHGSLRLSSPSRLINVCMFAWDPGVTGKTTQTYENVLNQKPKVGTLKGSAGISTGNHPDF